VARICSVCKKRTLSPRNKSGICVKCKKDTRTIPSVRLEDARKVKKIKRRCLKCDRPFLAKGRYNRICPYCEKKNSEASEGLSELSLFSRKNPIWVET